jgi:hypothetical protein
MVAASEALRPTARLKVSRTRTDRSSQQPNRSLSEELAPLHDSLHEPRTVEAKSVDSAVVDGAGSLQLSLLFLKAGPAGGRLRRPSSRRQRHDGNRATDLTLHSR